MNLKHYPPLFLLCIGFFLVLSSCDNRVTQPEHSRPLLDIPAHGLSALPGIVSQKGEPTVQASGDTPPAYELLKEYAQKNPAAPFIAVVGVWNAEKESYSYKSIPLAFTQEIIEKANGKTKYYWYKLNEADSGIIRNLAALIPAVPEARDAMTRWLQVKDRSRVVPENSRKPNTASPSVSSTGKSGGNIDRTQAVNCWKWFPETQWIYSICEDIVVTHDNDSALRDSDGGSRGWPTLEGGHEEEDLDGCPEHCGSGGSGGKGSLDGPPTTAPDGVPQEFYEGLNDVEKALCVLDPGECLSVFISKNIAEDWAKSQEPMIGDTYPGWNDPQDALRHARWNAEMTKRISSERAKEWADAHEYVEPGSQDPFANDLFARDMDFHNNQVGRNIGTSFPNDIANALLNARDNGDLWLWRCKATQTRFGCGNTPLD